MHSPLTQSEFRGAVKWVIIVSGVLFVIQQFTGPFLLQWFALTPASVVDHYRLWQVLTYAFLHGGVFHWLFNMFVFWAFGSSLERQWGTPYFIRFLIVTTLGSALCVIAMGPHSYQTTIGSSGAVFGLLVAFAMLFPHSVMYLYFVIPVKAWQAAALFGLIEVFAAFQGGASGIRGLAHLGGMGFGYLYIRYGTAIESRFSRLRFVTLRPVRKSPMLEEVTNDLVAEVDRILDKVSKQGSGALSSKEKQILDRYTRTRH